MLGAIFGRDMAMDAQANQIQQSDVKHMQCMEVWGGNRAIDSGVIMPGMDAWIYSRPCKDQPAGGDVHFVSTCAGGLLVRLVLADIAGHGEGVADMGSQLRVMMRRFINRHEQSNVVQSLNKEFTAASANGVFATAVVMTFQCGKNKLSVSNAGHPAPLWYQAKRRRWTLLEPGTAAEARGTPAKGIPWGIVDDSLYHQFESPLGTGDIVLSYTDSLAEAKGADGEMLGPGGLLRIASSMGNVTPSQLIPRLLGEIAAHDPDYASRDDVTCLAFRANGMRVSAPIWDMAFAPIRWMLAGTGMKFGYAGWKRDAWDAPIENGAAAAGD
jgi:hypothetical protein